MRLVQDRPDPECRQDGEPHHHDRPEQPADNGGAAALHQKQADQQHQRDRHDIRFEQRRGDLQPLDRAQDRNRRRDDPVAIEQRRADQPRHHDPQIAPLAAVRRAQHQRGQRQQAALAAIVGAHDDDDVFDRHDQDQRPENQRQRAEDRVLVDASEGQQGLPGRVERRCPDVAEHDPERRQRQTAGARAGLGCSAMRDGIRHRSRIPAGERAASRFPAGPGPAERDTNRQPSDRYRGPSHRARCGIGSCRERLRHIEQTNRRQGRSIGRSEGMMSSRRQRPQIAWIGCRRQRLLG